MTRPDPYTEWQRRELRGRLRLANAARRAGATTTAQAARRAVARLYPPPYSALEMAGIDAADEDRDLLNREAEWMAEREAEEAYHA